MDRATTPARDRVRKVTKTGAGAGTEDYKYDANDNVVSQTAGGVTTAFQYDRNRLRSASASPNGLTTTYGYDVFGRQQVASTAGLATERWTYDGFDRTAKYTKGSESTVYTYDPMDRLRSKTVTPATGATKTSSMDYLGLSGQTVTERSGGAVVKTYQYSSAAELLSQVVKTDAGKTESSYFSFNAHGDVDSITDENGDNRATYAYSAYGANDAGGSSGADKNGDLSVGAEPYNAFRFGTSRLDSSSGTYQMGSRSYSPGLDRFLSLDYYRGALSDLSLSASPFSSNRYVFASGNPLNRIDMTGHGWLSDLGHAALDVAGMVPVVGEVADLANGVWYTAEGNYVDAAFSFASAIPLAGNAVTAVKWARKGEKLLDDANDVRKVVDDAGDARRLVDDAVTGGKKADAGGGVPTKSVTSKPVKADPPKPKVAPSKPAASCNSFTAGTQVLLADGSSKPIQYVMAGDTVAATDPVTGVTESRVVTEVRQITEDKALTTLTIDTDGSAGSAIGTITATDGHPFWVDQDGAWIHAGDLKPGMWLRTPNGEQKQVTATSQHHEYTTVYNFTPDLSPMILMRAPCPPDRVTQL